MRSCLQDNLSLHWREIIQLYLADKDTGKSVEPIRGTPEHPFFTPNGMVEMGKLKLGMEVNIRNTDKHLIVKAVKREQHPEGVLVYNFEIKVSVKPCPPCPSRVRVACC